MHEKRAHAQFSTAAMTANATIGPSRLLGATVWFCASDIDARIWAGSAIERIAIMAQAASAESDDVCATQNCTNVCEGKETLTPSKFFGAVVSVGVAARKHEEDTGGCRRGDS